MRISRWLALALVGRAGSITPPTPSAPIAKAPAPPSPVTRPNPLLFKVKLEPAGHFGASGRYDQSRDQAFDRAFILTQLGLASHTQQAVAR